MSQLFERNGSRGPRVVAFGGGHGLSASLKALKLLTQNITAIVTVADDGGSSGRLREELGGLPPGDLRMALAALCDEGDWGQNWRDVLQYRFSSEGPLNGHSLGNLLISGLWDLHGDPVAGLDWIGRLLNVKGKVVPMATVPLEISAIATDSETGVKETIRGQVNVAKSNALIESVNISPAAPPAFPEAINAIEYADWAIFGPGSWFTSVIPHLMIPQLKQALLRSPAKKMLVLNLVPDSETSLMGAADYLRSWQKHAQDIQIDAVLIDSGMTTGIAELEAVVKSMGAHLISRNIANPHRLDCHDPLYLAAAYRELFVQFEGMKYSEM